MFFRKKPKPSPMPPWLKWGLIVFIGLAFAFQGLHPKNLRWGLPNLQTYKARLAPAAPAPCGPQAEPSETMGLRVFDRRIGSGKIIHCNDAVQARLAFWDISGKKLLQAEAPLTPGSGQDMAGLEQGIIGMAVGGARTLLIPPGGLQKPLRKDGPLATLALPENQTIIVDIELLP